MKFYILIVVLFGQLSAFSQVILEVPLRSHFNNEPIKRNGIQSLTVYADINPKGIGGFDGLNGKILEIEFDSNGNISYKRKVDDSKKQPFISFGSKDRFEYWQYSENGELVHLRRENRNQIYQLFNSLNEDGNLVQSVSMKNDELSSNRLFRWKDGEMVEYTDLMPSNEGSDTEWFYDEKGRAIRLIQDDIEITNVYDQVDDTVKTIETIKDSNGLISIETYAYLKQLEQHLVHYTHSNDKEVIDIEMHVSNDENGNPISYDLMNQSEGFHESEGKSELHYRIENMYDERDLLVSRKFYSTQDGEELLIRKEWFVYDTAPLIFKYEKCEIYEGYDDY